MILQSQARDPVLFESPPASGKVHLPSPDTGREARPRNGAQGLKSGSFTRGKRQARKCLVQYLLVRCKALLRLVRGRACPSPSLSICYSSQTSVPCSPIAHFSAQRACLVSRIRDSHLRIDASQPIRVGSPRDQEPIINEKTKIE